MGLLSTSKNLVSLWAKHKARQLQGTPNTKIDSGGSENTYRFDGQEIDRGTLRDIKDIRESGGVISYLVHAKALMQFGTGVEWQSPNEEVVEWLDDELNDLDNLVIDLGEDAIWYPYSMGEVVETRGGKFSHIEPVEPWTMLPVENEYGEIIAWKQEIQGDPSAEPEVFNPDELAAFVLNKSSARDKTGVSEVLRAEEEVRQFRENREAVNQAIEIAGFPHHIWKVGREGGTVIDDNELRRVRNMVDSMEGDTQFVMGRDVEHDMIKPGEFKFESIQEHDLRELALALGLPLELANVGSDGLGSGMPADLRLQLFERQARAAQRSLADQFVQQVARPLLEEYSPFPSDIQLEMQFGDPVSDKQEKAEFVDKAGENMTLNEKREMLGLPEAEDDELGESYRKPANIQAPEEEEPEDGGGIGGIFNKSIDKALDERDLEEIRALEEDFDATLFELVATEEQDDFETGARLGVGVEFPNSGVYVDWNIDAWPEEERLDGPHVSDYATIDDAKKVAQGEVRELSASELSGRGTGNRDLSDEGFRAFEHDLQRIHTEFVTADDTSLSLTEITESQVPEMVKQGMKGAIRSDAVFSHFEDLPSSELMDLRQTLQDMLTEDNWSLDNMATELSDRFDVSEDKAETWARTETQSIVNHAYEDAIEERGLEDETFKWVGSVDDRTTEACVWLLEQTNPKHGGEPVTLPELKELIQEAPEHDPELDTEPREFTPHISCRKRYVRVV